VAICVLGVLLEEADEALLRLLRLVLVVISIA